MGVPESIRSGESADVAVTVAETVQHFITAMDAVKLESRFVDELQPLLSDLMDSLTRLPESKLVSLEVLKFFLSFSFCFFLIYLSTVLSVFVFIIHSTK